MQDSSFELGTHPYFVVVVVVVDVWGKRPCRVVVDGWVARKYNSLRVGLVCVFGRGGMRRGRERLHRGHQ